MSPLYYMHSDFCIRGKCSITQGPDLLVYFTERGKTNLFLDGVKISFVLFYKQLLHIEDTAA